MRVSAFVARDLASVELEDGAGGSFRGRGVVDGCHAFFDGEGACAEGEHGFFAEEGGGFGGAQDGEAGAMVEAVGSRSGGGLDGSDGAGEGARDGGAEEAGR